MTSILEGMRAKLREDSRRSRLFWIRFTVIAILIVALLLALAGELPDMEIITP